MSKKRICPILSKLVPKFDTAVGNLILYELKKVVCLRKECEMWIELNSDHPELGGDYCELRNYEPSRDY